MSPDGPGGFLPSRLALRLLYDAFRLLFRLLYGEFRIRVAREVWGNGEPYYLAPIAWHLCPRDWPYRGARDWATRQRLGQAVAGADDRQAPVGSCLRRIMEQGSATVKSPEFRRNSGPRNRLFARPGPRTEGRLPFREGMPR